MFGVAFGGRHVGYQVYRQNREIQRVSFYTRSVSLTDPPVHLVLLVHLVPPLLNEKDGILGRRMSGGD
jgi:hypothetical protein